MSYMFDKHMLCTESNNLYKQNQQKLKVKVKKIKKKNCIDSLQDYLTNCFENVFQG